MIASMVRGHLARALFFAFALFLPPANAFVQAQEALTPLDVAKIRSVTQGVISPDGTHTAFVLSIPRTPWEEKDGPSRSELHVLDNQSGESSVYITSKTGVSSPHWTPDGKGIAFLAKRDGDEQRSLYVIPLKGGEARRAAMLRIAASVVTPSPPTDRSWLFSVPSP